MIDLLDLQGWNPWFGSLRENDGLPERSHLVSSDASVNAEQCIVCNLNLDKGEETLYSRPSLSAVFAYMFFFVISWLENRE
jgi:hypothetical protein